MSSTNTNMTEGERMVADKLRDASIKDDTTYRASAAEIDSRANTKWEKAKEEASIAATATKMAAADAKDALLGKSSASVARGQDTLESAKDSAAIKAHDAAVATKDAAYTAAVKTQDVAHQAAVKTQDVAHQAAVKLDQAKVDVQNKAADAAHVAAVKLDQAKTTVQSKAHEAVESLSAATSATRHMAHDALVSGKELLQDAVETIKESASNMLHSGKQVAQEVPVKVREAKERATIASQSGATSASSLKQKALEVKEEVRQLAQDAAAKTTEFLQPSATADPVAVARGTDMARRHEQMVTDTVQNVRDTANYKLQQAKDTIQNTSIEGTVDAANAKLFPGEDIDTSDPRTFSQDITSNATIGKGETSSFVKEDKRPMSMAEIHNAEAGHAKNTQLHSDLLTRPADPDVVQERADTGDAKFDF